MTSRTFIVGDRAPHHPLSDVVKPFTCVRIHVPEGFSSGDDIQRVKPTAYTFQSVRFNRFHTGLRNNSAIIAVSSSCKR